MTPSLYTGEDGACYQALTEWFARPNNSDPFPQFICPVLGRFLWIWHFHLKTGRRALVNRYLPQLLQIAQDGQHKQRGWMVLDWVVRVHTPAWLAAQPSLQEISETLRTLPVIADEHSRDAARIVVERAYKMARELNQESDWYLLNQASDAVDCATAGKAASHAADVLGNLVYGQLANQAAEQAAQSVARYTSLGRTTDRLITSAHDLAGRMLTLPKEEAA